MAAMLKRVTRRRSSVRWDERDYSSSISGPVSDNPVLSIHFSRDVDGIRRDSMKLVVSLEDLERWVAQVKKTRERWLSEAAERMEQRKRRGL